MAVVVVAGGMSLINKMLQDLDRRQALGAGAEAGAVRAASPNPQHREWFWRVVTLLLGVGVAWVLWTAYQMLPRPLVTNLAFMAAEEARSRPTPPPAAVVAVAPAVPVPAPLAQERVTSPTPDPSPIAEPVKVPPASEPLKLAHAIETPVREPRSPRVKPKETAKEATAPRRPKAESRPEEAAPARKASVDKRDRALSPAGAAETRFRRAALLLNQGRVSEAEGELAAALKIDPSHAAARQAYVALLLEQQRVEPARRLLEDALAIDPTHPSFALTLAQIHAGSRSYRAALEVLDRAAPGAQAAEFHAMRGAVLQRLGRDAEAVDALQAAIRGGPQPGTTWINLAISLENLGRKPEAAEAYRKALVAGPLAAEAREYAQDRARALE